MALTLSTLRRIADCAPITAGASLPGVFTYTSADNNATVTGVGYFNNASDRLPVGSIILLVSSSGGAANIRVVTANTGGVVTIS